MLSLQDLLGKHIFWLRKKNVVTVNLICVKIMKELKKMVC